MFRNLKSIISAVTLLFFVSLTTAETNFLSTWKAPDAKPIDSTGKKIGAFVDLPDQAGRRSAELHLAQEITNRGAKGVAVHSLIPEQDLKDKEKAKSILAKAGISGVVVIRPMGLMGMKADQMQTDPRYRSFFGAVSQPAEKSTAESIMVEVLIYSIDQDKLVWSAITETKAANINEFVHELASSVSAEMAKQGLLSKKK